MSANQTLKTREVFMWKNVGGIMVLAGALAACGSSTSDRALSGAGIGAGVGAAGGALTGSTLGGAALGGAAGAATGALTNQNQINLGKPWWK
jgi:osmotically inducible lipoprotein OsmB